MLKRLGRLLLLPALLALSGCFELNGPTVRHFLGYMQFGYGAPITPIPSGTWRDTDGGLYTIEEDLSGELDVYRIVTPKDNEIIAFLYDMRTEGYITLLSDPATVHWVMYDAANQTIEFRKLQCSMLSRDERLELGFPADVSVDASCFPKDGGTAALAALYANKRFDPAKHGHRRLTRISASTARPDQQEQARPDPSAAPTPRPALPPEVSPPDPAFLAVLEGRTIYLREPGATPPEWEEIDLNRDGSLETKRVWLKPDGPLSYSGGEGEWSLTGRRLCMERIAGADCFILAVTGAGSIMTATRRGETNPAYTDIRTRPGAAEDYPALPE